MKNKRQAYIFIFGQPFPRSELVKLCVVIVFFGLVTLIGGAIYFLDGFGVSLEPAKNLVENEPMGELVVTKENEKKEPKAIFFEDYLRLSGMDEVDSIRAVGVYSVNGIDMELTFLTKRPRLYRQTMVAGETRIEFGSNGASVWFEQTDRVVDNEDPALMQLNRSLAIIESAIPTLAWDYKPEGSNLNFELMPDQILEGRDCYVIKNSGLIEGSPVYHHIDKETGFECYRRASLQIAPKQDKTVELFYDEPLEDSKYPIPSGMKLFLDGRLYYQINFELVQINQGLPTFLFERSGEDD